MKKILAIALVAVFITGCGATDRLNEVDDTKTVEERWEEVMVDSIEQTIEAADGATLHINADINVDGIERVSRYEYELIDITEEARKTSLKRYFPNWRKRQSMMS